MEESQEKAEAVGGDNPMIEHEVRGPAEVSSENEEAARGNVLTTVEHEDQNHAGLASQREGSKPSDMCKGPEMEDIMVTEELKNDLIRSLLVLCREHDVSIPEKLVEKVQVVQEKEEIMKAHGRRRTSVHLLATLISENAELRESELSFIDGVISIIKQIDPKPFRYELRLKNVSYTVSKMTKHGDGDTENQVGNHERKVEVFDQSGLVHKLGRLFGCTKHLPVKVEKVLMDGVNLRLQSGKTYLILGAPGCGKSLLLKSIANTLRQDKHNVAGGSITINGEGPASERVYWSNLVMYVDQIDRLHALLTVKETLDFAFNARCAGTHRKSFMSTEQQVNDLIKKLDDEKFRVNAILEAFGIKRVEDTFVGDDSKVRGVSGGERKRVTVSEMMTLAVPVLCLDEISTGLDAATTFDIVALYSRVSKIINAIPIVSLLQPPPEVVALFDEVILLDSGRVIYSGPVAEVVGYFESLGYFIPDRMDTADWLQTIPTPDGAKFLKDSGDQKNPRTHLTNQEFVQAFKSSERGLALLASVDEPLDEEVSKIHQSNDFTKKYQNSWDKSILLVFQRELLLWRRDSYQWKMKVVQDLVMGIVVGTVFWQTDDAGSIMGILFQSVLFIGLAAMMSVNPQIDARGIFYKQQDANFYPTWAFVIGRSMAQFPNFMIDAFLYGTIVYWFSGLAFNDGASIGNFFIFLLTILVTAYGAALTFSVFSSAVKEKTLAQAAMAVSMVMFVIFSGFTVQPDVIPDYWIWVYWLNPFAWSLRSLIVNEFQSGEYDDIVDSQSGKTLGESYLERFGFLHNGEPYGFEWVWYGILFVIGVGLVAVGASCLALAYIRFDTGQSASDPTENEADAGEEEAFDDSFDLPVKPVNLSFKDVHYIVTASTSNEQIELLKGVDGYVEAGKMTALMGSSGAGKTTLMDVLSLRKSSGEVKGEVRLNGHLQEEKSFRRCTGYVEQFDVQSPQLTVLETIEFSAKLRLDERDEQITEESIAKFVDKTLHMLELNSIKSLLVGSDLTGGLSFEQRKRLSIAVELVSNPSIIFLDEPTSGLDARAASIVMRGLKRIADSGRAICATIHQPSQAIFYSFDSLLLLKRGGEVVFFGDLGKESSSLISYLERYDETPSIKPGENPATWMLSVIGAGSKTSSNIFDYSGSYAVSDLRKTCMERIAQMEAAASDKNLIQYDTKYATNRRTQSRSVFRRLFTIYLRSPSYNGARVFVSAVVALIFGSIYASQRTPENESDMNSRITSIFVSTIFLGVSSFNTVLPLFEVERNMFYRHKAALMYNQKAIGLSFTFAEIPFVMFASMVFCVCFYFLVGFSTEAYKFFLYYLFFTLNMGTMTYLGQTLMSLLRDSETAQGLGSVFVGMAALFCGILIRPQNIPDFWLFMYWLLPLRWVLEGLIASQFHNDDTRIDPSLGSPFNEFVQNKCKEEPNETCFGTAEDWVNVSFENSYEWDNIPWDIVYLVGLIIVSRIVCYVALTKLNYLMK